MISIGGFVLEISLEQWQVILAVLGPGIVALVTGLNTPGYVKAALAIASVLILGTAEALIGGQMTGNLFADLVVLATIWQSIYAMFWKGLDIASTLQEVVPIKLLEQ